MEKKKGTKYECGNCGIVVSVDKTCGCSECDLICCAASMKEVKTVSKARKRKYGKPAKKDEKP